MLELRPRVAAVTVRASEGVALRSSALDLNVLIYLLRLLIRGRLRRMRRLRILMHLNFEINRVLTLDLVPSVVI